MLGGAHLLPNGLIITIQLIKEARLSTVGTLTCGHRLIISRELSTLGLIGLNHRDELPLTDLLLFLLLGLTFLS